MKFFSATWLLSSFITFSTAMSASIPAQDAALAALPLEARTGSPYLVAAFETRLPNTTVAGFIDYYDNTHIPIIKKAMGSSFPLTHARYYLKRQSGSDSLVIFGGTAADFDYDVITIMTFASEAHLNEFNTKYQDPAIGGVIIASAEKFIITSILRIIGIEVPHITTRWQAPWFFSILPFSILRALTAPRADTK